jgi:hypothetical protein
MLGKNGIKVLDHIFPHKFTLKFLGDHSLTPCISVYYVASATDELMYQGKGNGTSFIPPRRGAGC